VAPGGPCIISVFFRARSNPNKRNLSSRTTRNWRHSKSRNKHGFYLDFNSYSGGEGYPDIGYNCILGTPFLLKFLVVILTAYATIKMPGPKGVIVIKSD
jgi:hypothetical protein